MKLFLDSANLKEIEAAVALGVIRGVTTNPSLLAQEGEPDFAMALQRITALVDGPISAEVVSEESELMVSEALQLVALDPEHIVIKIPICQEGLKATKILAAQGVRTNLTLIFTAQQALLAAAAGASFVSPFIGRLDDIGQDGMVVVRDIAEIFDFYGYEAEIIAASIRHPIHVLEAAKAGADIATVPWRVMQQMIDHPLTTAGIKRFRDDWQRLQS